MEQQEAWRQVTQWVRLYANRLTRLCFLYLGDYALAEDAVQETYLRAWRQWASFAGRSHELTWLSGIAINVCRNIRRGRWFRITQGAPSLDSLPEATTTFEPQDDTVILQVMALPVKYREVVLLHYYQELPVSEVARVLGTPKSTVTVRLKRARDMLRPVLERWYFDEEEL